MLEFFTLELFFNFLIFLVVSLIIVEGFSYLKNKGKSWK